MPYGHGIAAHEASRLERGGVAFSLVGLTSGRESLTYGKVTRRGVASRVPGLPGTWPAGAIFLNVNATPAPYSR